MKYLATTPGWTVGFRLADKDGNCCVSGQRLFVLWMTSDTPWISVSRTFATKWDFKFNNLAKG